MSTTYSFHDQNWNPVPAVYIIYNSSMQTIYVGQTDNLKRRLEEHKNDTTHCMHRFSPALIQAEVVRDVNARLLRERGLILSLQPLCNQR